MLFKTTGLILALVLLLSLCGCKNDSSPEGPDQLNESEILAKYLEANGNLINTTTTVLISADNVRSGQTNKLNQAVLDIRIACDFTSKGHIEGAVNIQIKDIPWYYIYNKLDSLDKVIIVCATGQASSYAAMLMRYYGFNNVYALNFGMSGWNQGCDSWSGYLSDNRAAQFVTNETMKNNKGALPLISTGKSTGSDILAARLKIISEAGFNNVQCSNENVFINLSDYYVIDYCPYEQYLKGHIPGAVNIVPGEGLGLNTNLKTIPTDKPVIIYCATGEASAAAASFLRLLGYDAHSILYGNNGMNYSTMQGRKFTPADIHNYPLVH
jgi:rhodanese-related sulfurtransferase